MRINIKKRTGKDFLEYVKRSLIDQKSANDWALSKFVVIDGDKLELDMIADLNPKAYLILTSKLFPVRDLNEFGITETEYTVIFPDNYTVRQKEITSDTLSRIQTDIETKNNMERITKIVPYFYSISPEELLEKDYFILCYLMEKVTFFLSEITRPTNSFDLADVWRETASKIAGE